MTTPHAQLNQNEYVLGFAFSRKGPLPFVCLIEKQKPDWQKGRLNGVGGKVESTDKGPEYAMTLEFMEETGVVIMPEVWYKLTTMQFLNGAVVHCYCSDLPPSEMPRTMETEQVFMLPVDPRYGRLITTRSIIRNLTWLIPMAYQQLTEPLHERIVFA